MKEERLSLEFNCCSAGSGSMKIFMLGGIFLESELDKILEYSKGPVQNAADAFQKKVILSLNAIGVRVTVINLPFIGSFPKRYRRAFNRGKRSSFGLNKVFEQPFSNLAGYKIFSRFLSSLRAFFRFNSPDSVFLIYSAHTPFLMAALVANRVLDNFRFVIIVPDLPEYMSDSPGYFKRLLIRMSNFVLSIAVKNAIGVIGLTQEMQKKLGVNAKKFLTWEGCFEANQAFEESLEIDLPDKFIFYSGGLNKRYGVGLLLDVFKEIDHPDYYLVLCGSGDLEEKIVEASHQQCCRVRFLGQLPRKIVMAIQRRASFLVNPRLPFDEFTKYSFPSKTLEYMASGRPILMFDLPGVPREYFDYLFIPDRRDKESFRSKMSSLMATDASVLDCAGGQARDFIENKKSPSGQGELILKFLQAMVDNDE